MSTPFSSNLALCLAAPASYRKGKEYLEDGKVSKLWEEEEIFKAIVKGTRNYTVSISAAVADDILATCTCPYEGEGICKHAVAAILAFAQHPEFTTSNRSNKNASRVERAGKMLTSASETQVRKFLKELLLANEQTTNDFGIFLQGPKETSATAASYKEKVAHQLDELDLDDLLQAWYSSGEDHYGYDDYYNESKYDEETVAAIIGPFRGEAEKYADNENFAESNKILQAIIDALREKSREVAEDYPDLEDWFMHEVDETLGTYYHILSAPQALRFKKASLEYIALLFEHDQFSWRQEAMEKGLRGAIAQKSEAEICLHALLRTVAKTELSTAESSLLAHVYFLIGEPKKFEEVSLRNLEKNLDLALPLLKFYKEKHRKAAIVQTADRVLNYLAKNPESFGYAPPSIEISIREFLKDIFDPKREYREMVANLEALFLQSAKQGDYEALTAVYRDQKEKEEFLKKMKTYFTAERDIQTMFNVFTYEGKKEEILELVKKYKDAPCFPSMIAAISGTYTEECFTNYQQKIKGLLQKANINVYPEVAHHLKQMKHIGLSEKWRKFVDGIKTEYSRRRRLMEELKNAGL